MSDCGGKIASLRLAPSELQGLALDHRAGFLLSLIDGMTCVEDLIELAGMPREDAEEILGRLVALGAIALRD